MPAACTTIGLLKQSNFTVILKEELNVIEFMVQEAVLPGMQLGEVIINHMSQVQQRPGDNITWNLLSLQIITDEKLLSYKQAWQFITKVKNPKLGTMDNVNQPFDAELHILTNKNNVSHKIKFYDAWIQSIGDLQLTQNTTEDEPILFNIELQYDYYEFI